MPPVVKPHFEATAPEAPDPEMVQATRQWLMFLAAQLEQGLAEEMEMCAIFEEQLKPIVKDHWSGCDGLKPGSQEEALCQAKSNDRWFSCGGQEGYTVGVDEDGVVIYVTDAAHPGWTLPTLREILGREKSISNQGPVVEHHWVVDASDGGPDLWVSFNEPKDRHSPFVGLKYSARPAKAAKSGAGLTL